MFNGMRREVFEDTRNYGLTQETTSYRGSVLTDAESPQSLIEDQELRNRSAKGDSGHPFDTYKYTMGSALGDRNIRAFNSLGGIEFHGTMFAYQADVGFSSQRAFDRQFPVVPESLDSGYYGSLAINKTIPTKSVANLGIALTELLQDLPTAPLAIGKAMMSGNAKKFVPASGKDYLAVQFGIVPTVRDVQEICKAIFTANAVIEQYLRDSGRDVRRKYHFPPTTDTRVSKTDLIIGPELGYVTGLRAMVLSHGGEYYNSRVEGRLTIRRSDQLWFSGAYRYFVNGDDSLWGKLRAADQLANKLMGTRLTLETLWEAMPFSWLFDWYLNIGTLVSNAQAFSSDDLVLRYGYLMNTTVSEYVATTTDSFGFTQADRAPISTSFRTTRKQRFRANPYGFARNPNSFSGKQWAILGALGLTKAPRRLIND